MSLGDFCFASATRNDPRGKQKHVVDAFRTIYWFHTLRDRVGATSAYQMDGLLDPQQPTDFVPAKDRKKKWRNYWHGQSVPSEALVAKIELDHPGTRGVLEHVLWDALRRDRAATRHCELWFKRLHPNIQSVVWSRESRHEMGGRLQKLTSTRYRMLERRAGLDALACLIIWMCERAEAGDQSEASRLARATCRMLLILSAELFIYGIALPLAEYVTTKVMPLTSGESKSYWFGQDGFLVRARLLHSIVSAREGDENCYFSPAQRAAVYVDALNGVFGWRLAERLAPIENEH